MRNLLRFAVPATPVPFRRRGRIAGILPALLAAALAVPVQAGTPVSPSPATSSGPIPALLRNEWVASQLTVEGLDTASDAARVITFSGVDTFQFARPWGQESLASGLTSRAAIASDGRLELTTETAADGCQVGDVGLYAFSIAEADLRLAIQPGADDCATRAAFLPGDWQGSGTGCETGQFCLGPLTLGTHATALFTPRGPGEPAARVKLGAMSYTVPEGWANTFDDFSGYVLMQAAPTEQGSGGPKSGPNGVYIFARPAALVADGLCPMKADPSVGRSLDDLVAFVESHPGLVVSHSQPVTIGGHAGRLLDVDIAPAWTSTCNSRPGDGPSVLMFADAGWIQADGTTGDSWSVGPEGGIVTNHDPVRILLLDIGGGDTVVAFIDAYDPADIAAVVTEATPILESLRFAD